MHNYLNLGSKEAHLHKSFSGGRSAGYAMKEPSVVPI